MTSNMPNEHPSQTASTILLLGVSGPVEKAVGEAAQRERLQVEPEADLQQGLERARVHPSRVAVVVVGDGARAPLEAAQEVNRLDRGLPVVLLASDLPQRDELARTLLLTPFVGEDVVSMEAGNPGEVARQVNRAAQRRRRRQELTRTSAAVLDQMEDAFVPPRITDHFGRLLEEMPLGVITVDAEGGVHGWNRRARDLLAAPEAWAPGEPLSLLFASPEREEVHAYLEEAVRGSDVRPPRSFERSLSTGRTQILELTAVPVEVTEGRRGAMVLVQDITAQDEARRQRQRTEEALRHQRRWFEATLSSIGDGVIATDAQGRVTFMNRVAEELTGWSLQESSGLPSTEVFHIIDEASGDLAPSPIQGVLQEGEVVGLANDTLLLAKEGRPVPIDDSGAPIRDDAGQVVGAVVVFRDITERQESERALRASEERLRLVIESLTDFAVFTTDREGRIRSWNSGAERILGWEGNEVMGASMELIFPEEDRRNGVPEWEIRTALETGRATDDRWHVRKDGSQFWASGVLSSLQGGGDAAQPPGFVKVLRDQTHAKRSREQLEARARQQEAVARFGRDALASTDLEELLEEAARVVAETLGVEFCKVLRLLPDGAHLRLEAGIGWAPGLVGGWLEDAGHGSQEGYTLEVGAPVVLRDLEEETRFEPPPLLVEHGITSGLTVMIGSARDPWGVLGAHTARQRDFSADDIHFLQAMANILAAAIQRQATEDELHLLNETLEQRVEERTAEAERRAAQLQQMATELAQTEQRERRRLADMLHDHLQQYLAAGWMRLDALEGRVVHDPDLKKSLEQVRDLVSQSIDISRNLTVELSPPVVQRGTLGKAFEWLADWVHEQHGLAVEVDIRREANPESEEVRNLVFQSVRELLFNATKHSGAERAVLRMTRPDPAHFQVTVSDTGAGFDPDELVADPAAAEGFGLMSIRERLDVLGGSMEVESAPGEGTTITLTVPLEEPADSHDPDTTGGLDAES